MPESVLRRPSAPVSLLCWEVDPEIMRRCLAALARAGIRLLPWRVSDRTAWSQALEEFRPDLVLVQASAAAPSLSAALAALHARYPTLPLVIVAGRATERALRRRLRVATADYLSPAELARLPRLVERARQRQTLAEANLQLQEKVRDLTDFIENANVGLHWVDGAGRILWANKAELALLGYAAEEYVGRPLADFHADPAVLADLLARLQRREELSNYEARLRHKDGSLRHVLLNATVVWQQGRFSHTRCFTRDITERKQFEAALDQAYQELLQRVEACRAELPPAQTRRAPLRAPARPGATTAGSAPRRSQEQLLQAIDQLDDIYRELHASRLRLIQAEKMESVGRLAAGVAHEVKNPLAVLTMGIDYLADHVPALDRVTKRILKDMLLAVDRASGAIQGLLDFSVPTHLERRRTTLPPVLAESLTLLKHELARHQVKVAQALPPRLPALLLDRQKIMQVFVNLLMNALHAMPGGGTLTLRARTVPLKALNGHQHLLPAAGQQVVVVEVEDTGPGIPEEQLVKVFEPFYTTKRLGTGLGLHVTREIMHLHGGAIFLANRPPHGLRATLFFPVARGGLPLERRQGAPVPA